MVRAREEKGTVGEAKEGKAKGERRVGGKIKYGEGSLRHWL